MKVDAVATEPHYLRHVLPVWMALPDEIRGDLRVADRLRLYVETAGLKFNRLDVDPRRAVLASGFKDMKMCRRYGKRILMEHGIGQTYDDFSGSYAGGPYREEVNLFLCPNYRVQKANLETNPDTPAEVIGVPAMDPYHNSYNHPSKRDIRDIITISFHWQPKHGVPEMGSALGYYAKVLKEVNEHFDGIMRGHAHPRISDQAEAVFRGSGIKSIPLAEVYNNSQLHICDNSSVLYEFASLDLPVVVLNAPYMRRNVHHGLRFWEYADVGIQCDEPEGLISAIEQALAEPHKQVMRRREIIDWLFPYRGYATFRAATVISKYAADW